MTTNTPTPAPDLDERVAALMRKAAYLRYAPIEVADKKIMEFEQAIRAELQKPALHEPVSDQETIDAIRAHHLKVTTESMIDMRRAIDSVLQGRAKPAQEVNDIERLDIYADEGGTLIVTPNPNGEYVRACDYDAAKRLPAAPVLPEGWVPLNIEHEPGYPEEVAFGPQHMMDRLKKWLDQYFAMSLAQPAAPVELPVVGDTELLNFMANSQARYLEMHCGMWRVYQDHALPHEPNQRWIAMSTPYAATPREAIRAAIAAGRKA